MKNLRCIKEGEWKNVLSVELTNNEKTILESTKTEDFELQRSVLEEVNKRKYTDANSSDIDLAQSVYNKEKPKLEEGDVYQLISVDLTIDDKNSIKGILNCRVNKEHKQIRF